MFYTCFSLLCVLPLSVICGITRNTESNPFLLFDVAKVWQKFDIRKF
nr:MAG TPA: hypothetical protein [Caudoviricetes sp.]